MSGKPVTCAICRSREARPDGKVCYVCMGLEKEDVAMSPQNPKQKKTAAPKSSGAYFCTGHQEHHPSKEFYPSNRTQCKRYLKEKRKQAKLSAPAKNPEGGNGVKKQSQTTAPATETPETPTCTDCSQPFEAYQWGSTRPKVCKTCITLRSIRGLEASLLSRISKNGNGVIVLKFHEERDRRMFEAIQRIAEEERRTPEAQVLYWISKQAEASAA